MASWRAPLLWKLTAREMGRRPGRTLLTLFGIVIGVAAAVAVAVTLQGTRRAHSDMFQALAGRAALEVVDAGLGKFRPERIADVRHVAGVRAGVATLQVPTVLVGTKGAVPVMVLGIEPKKDEAARDYVLREGRFLDEKDGVVLEAGFAAANGIARGDWARFLTTAGDGELVVTGLLEPLGPAAFNGGAMLFMPLPTAQRLFGFLGDINSYQLILEDNADPARVLAEARAVVPPGFIVQEPSSRGALGRESMMPSEHGLAAISVSSLVAGAFMILNAFLMSLGERRRQLAILRALGATRTQVTRMLLREALTLGVAGSVLGLGLGFLLSLALRGVMGPLLGVTLPELHVSLEPFLLAFGLGPGIAVLATFVPARRAGRRSPLPDLLQVRGDRAEPVRRWPGYIGIASLGLVVILTIAIVAGWVPGAVARPFLAPLVGLYLAAWVLVVPLIFTPLLHLVRRLLTPILGMEAGLAVRQLQRHQGRTTLTAGVLLVAVIFALGFGQSLVNNLRDIDNWFDRISACDFILRKTMPDLTTTITTAALPDRLEEFEASPLVERIDKVSFLRGQAEGLDVSILACTYTPGRLPTLALVTGSPDEVRRGLLRGEVVLGTALAQRLGVTIGDHISLTTREGPRRIRIAGTTTEYTGGGMAVYIEWSTAAKLFDLPGVHAYMVTARPGQAEALAPLLQAYSARRSLLLQSRADFRAAFDRQTGGFLGFVWALIALVFVVASLGIMNTLTLTVLEQTRELGTLRAVGMKRRQVRKLILAQALALGLISLVPGLVGGIGLAVMISVATYPLTGQSVAFHLDPWLIGGCFLVALAIVALAAHFPARRAVRLRVIEALQYE